MGRCRLVVLDKTIEVACAPARAFALLSHPEALPAWQPWTTAAATAPGSRFRLVHDVCGVRLAWEGHAEADPHRRLAFAQEAGDFEVMEGVWDLQPLGGDRTRVRLRMRVALPFVLPRLLTEAEISRALSTSLDESLYNLKSVLEAPAQLARERAGSGLPRAAPGRLAAFG